MLAVDGLHQQLVLGQIERFAKLHNADGLHACGSAGAKALQDLTRGWLGCASRSRSDHIGSVLHRRRQLRGVATLPKR